MYSRGLRLLACVAVWLLVVDALPAWFDDDSAALADALAMDGWPGDAFVLPDERRAKRGRRVRMRFGKRAPAGRRVRFHLGKRLVLSSLD